MTRVYTKRTPEQQKAKGYCKPTPERQAIINDNVTYHRYRITGTEYRARVAAQNNLCACCGGIEPIIDPRSGKRRNLSIDHNHKTGENLSLLCSSCNIALGHMQHETARVTMLLSYCKKHYGDEDAISI